MTAAEGHEVLYEFPQPPKPKEISHGEAEGGWNFGGSMGFVYEVIFVILLAKWCNPVHAVVVWSIHSQATHPFRPNSDYRHYSTTLESDSCTLLASTNFSTLV